MQHRNRNADGLNEFTEKFGAKGERVSSMILNGEDREINAEITEACTKTQNAENVGYAVRWACRKAREGGTRNAKAPEIMLARSGPCMRNQLTIRRNCTGRGQE